VPGVQVADVGGGSLPAAIGVLAALMERETTGRGRHLDISLARGSAAFGTVAFSGGADQERGAGMLTGGAPCYRCFRTSDGRLLALGALEPRFFSRFCELAGREDLAHEGLTWGEDALGAIETLTELIGSQTARHWLDLCDGHDVCLSLVRTPDEAMQDPDMASVIRQVEGFTVVTTHLGVPAPAPTRSPSALGADAPSVTRRLSLETELVQQAVEAGALLWSGEDKP
jgi:crotonobetainyl-CoA:carnitine CoA-transferase CaiB-like acyl-CoA transferase